MPTNKEMITVMAAYEAGKPIQVLAPEAPGWRDTKKPRWDWARCNYRVRPLSLRLWVNTYSDGSLEVFPSESEALTVGKTSHKSVRVAVPMQEVDV
jgi:hypothetical protein